VTSREDANRLTYERADIIHEMLAMDGVPPDMFTAVALMSLGIRMHHDILGDTERLAVILEQWADGIRHGQYLHRPIIEPKGD
jgi:hypothetical protein